MSIDSILRISERGEDKLRFLSELARIKGPKIWYDLLADTEAWDNLLLDPNGQGEEIQNAALSFIAQVQKDLVFIGVRTWACAGISHRLGIFRHRKSGVEMNLIPGRFADICHNCKGKNVIKIGNIMPIPCVTCRSNVTPLSRGIGWSYRRKNLYCAINPFFAARWPITESQWRQITGREKETQLGDDYPVTGIGHSQAVESLGQVGLQLPDQYQWVHLAQAATRTEFYWGDTFDPWHCWHYENSGHTQIVDEVEVAIQGNIPRVHSPIEHDHSNSPECFGRNSFGIVDTYGNIEEWLHIKTDSRHFFERQDRPYYAGYSFAVPADDYENDSVIECYDESSAGHTIGVRAVLPLII